MVSGVHAWSGTGTWAEAGQMQENSGISTEQKTHMVMEPATPPAAPEAVRSV